MLAVADPNRAVLKEDCFSPIRDFFVNGAIVETIATQGGSLFAQANGNSNQRSLSVRLLLKTRDFFLDTRLRKTNRIRSIAELYSREWGNIPINTPENKDFSGLSVEFRTSGKVPPPHEASSLLLQTKERWSPGIWLALNADLEG